MDNENDNEDKVFIRADLDKTSTGKTAYYRLDKGLKDFLNLCLEKEGEIEAVILTKEHGQYNWNIGFVLPDKELTEDEDIKTS